MKMLRDMLAFNRQLDKVREHAPPATRLFVSENVMPWMEVVFGCVYAGAEDVERVKMVLWQAGLYLDPNSPDGKPGGDA